MTQPKSINWTNTLFLILTPIIGIIGTIVLCSASQVHWQTWVLAASMLVAGGLSITAGYHRLFSHKAYKAAWPVQLFFVLFGSASFEGSVLDWCTDHRDHHRFTDTDKDPYSIKEGFWHAHIGWLLTLDPKKRGYNNVDDLKNNRLLRFQQRHYFKLSILMGFIFPMAIASLWGDPLSGLIIAGALRITLGHHGTFCINSLCHVLGKRTYSDTSSACDNWFSALLTFGEGYHNYHHKFPIDYRNGVRFYQYDPTKWLIRSLSFVGLASDLRRIPRYRIIQVTLETYERTRAGKSSHTMLDSLQESIMSTIIKIREFEGAYAESRSKEYRMKLKRAKSDLKDLFHAWKRLRYVYCAS